MKSERPALRVAIACGGTGGHLFPGLAVGHELVAQGCEVSLLISPKEVDQQAVRGAESEFNLVTLPAVGLSGRNFFRFLTASFGSWRSTVHTFRPAPPHAVLAMGGFTSAPPVLAGGKFGAITFLHESNTIPGRANRWLAHIVQECFVGFPEAGERLWNQRVAVTGTPVRPQFAPMDAAGARTALGLRADQPVLAVVGGSQGASGLNRMVTAALPQLMAQTDLQIFHLTGPLDCEEVRAAYAPFGRRARVQPFCSEMELLLGAATLAVSRSGASSLAELAAMGVPSLLVPFPAAVDNHQFHNASAFAGTGAARLLEQRRTSPDHLAATVRTLLADAAQLEAMAAAATRQYQPDAAAVIAGRILDVTAQMKKLPLRPRPLAGKESGMPRASLQEVAA